jgi:hypothetical protein
MVLKIAIATSLGLLVLGCHSRFPAGTFDPFVDDWYSRQLRAANEKLLVPSDGDDAEVYRFSWIPSFHPTTTVRVIRSGKDYHLIAKRLTGAGGYSPGHVASSRYVLLSQNQGEMLAAWITDMQFWAMPTEEGVKQDEKGNRVLRVDGAEWLLEGADQHRYHAVTRWFHHDYPSFEQACVCLIVWSGLNASLEDMKFYRFEPVLLARCSSDIRERDQ